MSETLRHPLEPLNADEVRHAVELLRSFGKVTPTTRFVSVSLKEPPKELVHSFASQPSIPREALAVLFDNGTNSCFEAEISITNAEVLSWKHMPGAQPTMTIDKQVECEQAVLASPEFRAALKRLCDTDDVGLVMVDIRSAGSLDSLLLQRSLTGAGRTQGDRRNRRRRSAEPVRLASRVRRRAGPKALRCWLAAEIPRPRSGRDVHSPFQCRFRASRRQRRTDRSAGPELKCFHRAVDQVDPSRVPPSLHHLPPETFRPPRIVLRRVLQIAASASIAGQSAAQRRLGRGP